MSTGTITLPIGTANLPDGTSSNLFPGITRVKSSASAPTPYFLQVNFDGTVKEQLMFSFRMPVNYASSPVLKLQFKMTAATTGTVVMEGRLAAVTPGDATDVDTKAFAASNASASTTVPATTAGKLGEISIALTNADSLAAGDFVVLYVARLPADAGDTATSDLELVAISLEYTTT